MLTGLFRKKDKKPQLSLETKVPFAALSLPEQKLLNNLASLKVPPHMVKGWKKAFTEKLPREDAIAITGELLRLSATKENKLQTSHLTMALIQTVLSLPGFPIYEANEKFLALTPEEMLNAFLTLFASPNQELINLFLPYYCELNLNEITFIQKLWPVIYLNLVALNQEVRHRFLSTMPQLIIKDFEWLSPLAKALKKAKSDQASPTVSQASLLHLRKLADPVGVKNDSELKTRAQELAEIWEYLATAFPEGSPRHQQFKQVSADILEASEQFARGKHTFDETEETLSRLIAPSLNLSIARLTPIQRFSLGSPLDEDTLKRFAQRLVKEGARLKEATVQYPTNWKTTLQEVWGNRPWPIQMVTPLIQTVPLTPQQLAARFEPRLKDLLSQLNAENQGNIIEVEAYNPPLQWCNTDPSSDGKLSKGQEPAIAARGRKRVFALLK